MEAKETVRALLNRLPDNCSLDEVLYHLYVLQEVAKGRADAEAGRTITHAEVAEQLTLDTYPYRPNPLTATAELCVRGAADKAANLER